MSPVLACRSQAVAAEKSRDTQVDAATQEEEEEEDYFESVEKREFTSEANPAIYGPLGEHVSLLGGCR